jgi:hypothetical protein
VAAEEEELLAGGVANAGAVARVGDEVRRPWNDFTGSTHRLLHDIRKAGFSGVPIPLGRHEDGRERLSFVQGDVPVPPYPAWAQSDQALASVAALMRRFHDAARSVGVEGVWSGELADTHSGPSICHNDVCLENVVFLDGSAVALLDWEFAAPGRPVYDLAQMARMCVPVDDDLNAGRLGWGKADRPQRLRLVSNAYGLDHQGRSDLLSFLDESMRSGGRFVLRRVEAGDDNFIRMWESMGGMERYDRRRTWWSNVRNDFARALR